MTGLQIAPGLTLDADYIGGGTVALLAKKGAGKTYTGRVLAEEFWKAKVPFVALDPMDAWWGLRSSADGTGEGIPVAIFGGPHGDAPLEPESGKLMADLVVDERLSMVLSLKHLGTRTAERRFALDFLERLYRRNSELVHLMIDEADLFAPQKPQAGDAPLLGVTENIVRRGRNSGIGITLITQRPAVLNKDVLTQVDALCVMRMLGPQDRNAIDDWVGEHGDRDIGREVKDSLPTLQTGECWWWVPEHGILKQVKVRASRTFDSSPTRKRGEHGREPKNYADVDMAAIEAKMAETIERARASDPTELRKQVRSLKAQLERSFGEVEQPLKAEIARLEAELEQRPPETVEVPVVGENDVKALRDAIAGFDRVEETLNAILDRVAAAADPLVQALNRVAERGSDGRNTHTAGARPAPARPAPAPRGAGRPAGAARPAAPRPRPAGGGEVTGDGLSGPEQRVLDALAWYDALGIAAPEKIQVGAIAGYRVGKKVGGTYGNILSSLSSKGLVVYPTPGLVTLTVEGAARARDPELERTNEAFQQAVIERLNGPEERVLRELISVHPEPLSKQELGARAGYTVGDRVGGTFGNILGRLRTLGWIDYPSQGQAVATDLLFPLG